MNARYIKNGKTRFVKNLGWLRKHAGEVTQFKLVADAVGNDMIAILEGGKVFKCEWVDKSLMIGFTKRRCFRGVEVKLNCR